MTIPTRDELIERARDFAMSFAFDQSAPASVGLADFALAEIRRAVVKELEALRGQARYAEYTQIECGEAVDVKHIDARLAALRASQSEAPQRPEGAMRQTKHDKPGADLTRQPGRDSKSKDSATVEPDHDCPVTMEHGDSHRGSVGLTRSCQASERAEGRAASSPCPPPALSDADVLERAAEIMRAHGYVTSGRNLTEQAAALRAASAPEPVDVFRAFSMWTDDRDHKWIEGHARDWFGPLVDVVKSAAIWEDDIEDLRRLAACALEALRQRAQEASR